MILTLPTWMRRALLITAVMNIGGCVFFVPQITFLRELIHLPEAHHFYLWLIAVWILCFGVVYLWVGLSGKPYRAFIMMAALGKISFWLLLFLFWAFGDLSFLAPVFASGDLMFGLAFAYWLWSTRTTHPWFVEDMPPAVQSQS